MAIKFPKLKPWQIGGLAGLGWGLITAFLFYEVFIFIKGCGPHVTCALLLIVSFLPVSLAFLFCDFLALPIFLPLWVLSLLILPDSFLNRYIVEATLYIHVISWIAAGIIYGKIAGIIAYIVKNKKKRKTINSQY